jgi:uncharacterized membrane protein
VGIFQPSSTSLLFITNLIGTIFSGILVFLWQRYGSLERAQGGIVVSVLMMIVIGIPLGLSFNQLLVQSNSREQVSYLVRNELPFSDGAKLQAFSLRENSEVLTITLDLLAPVNSITAEDVRRSQAILAEQLQRPVDLNLRVIPVEEFSIPATP